MPASDNAELPVNPSIKLSKSILEHEKPEEVEEGDWIIVKKQRIVIWLPPPSTEHLQRACVETANTKAKARKVAQRCQGTSKRTLKLSKKINEEPAVLSSSNDELQIQGELRKPVITNSEDGAQALAASIKSQAPSLITVTPLDNGVKDNGQDHLAEKPSVQQILSSQRNVVIHRREETIKFSEKRIMTPKLPLSNSNVAKLKLRAWNLKRKLQVLGGLRKWLVSKGLSRFINIFEREKLGMYQLVNLTMDKLKDMGADAVGPRRKLIHAIDNLCQPQLL